MIAKEYTGSITKGYESTLDNLTIRNDTMRITLDTHRLFIDSSDERFEITDFIKGMTEEEIRNQIAPLPKFYYASDTHRFLMYDVELSDWIVCGGELVWRGTRAELNRDIDIIPDGTRIHVTDDTTAEYTLDYNNFVNKPKINNVELSGNKSLSDLGIMNEIEKTYSTYVTQRTGVNALFSRIGKIVIVNIDIASAQVVTESTTWQSLFDIPSGYRPSSNGAIVSHLFDPNKDEQWLMMIPTNQTDKINVYGKSTVTDASAYAQMVYLTNDSVPEEE